MRTRTQEPPGKARSEVAARTNTARTAHIRAKVALDAGYESWEAFIKGTVGLSSVEAGRLIGRSETMILAARREIIGPDWRNGTGSRGT